jgi:glycosyltransferase involved in cell wall biosynthesis
MDRTSSGRERVLVLSMLYQPVPNFITADVAEALARRARVTVVTAHPSYPLGRFYPGTRWWRVERRVENGVTVWRLPHVPSQSMSVLARAASYLSFALAAALVAPFVAGRPTLVWVYNTPFTTALAALWFRLRGARLVYTAADLWPESMLATGVTRPGPLARALFAYSRAINRAAHLIVCSTRGAVARYRGDGIPRERLAFVPVWVQGIPEAEAAESGDPAAGAEGDVPALVYAGNLGPAQRVDTLIRAAALLERDGVPVRVDIYGTGAAEASLRELAEALGTRTVRFHGRVSPEEAFSAARAAAAQVVALEPGPMFRTTIPSKLSFSMAAGAPLLYGLEGEAGDIAAATRGGVRFDAADPASLAAAARDLLSRPAHERLEMRRSLVRCYREQFARSTLIGEYVRLLAPPDGAAARGWLARPLRSTPLGQND